MSRSPGSPYNEQNLARRVFLRVCTHSKQAYQNTEDNHSMVSRQETNVELSGKEHTNARQRTTHGQLVT